VRALGLPSWVISSKYTALLGQCDTPQQKTVADFGEQNRWDKHLDSPKDTIQILLPPEVKPVKYVSFKEISNRLNAKLQEFIREFYRSIREDISDDEKIAVETRIKEIEEQKIVDPEEASFLKDTCFSHEKEVRANVKVFLRNDVLRDAGRDPKNKQRIDFFFGGAFSYIPEARVLPKVIHLPITYDFIESVCFDPRVPSFIRKEQEIIIRRLWPDVIIEQSDAFGYLPDSVDITLSEEPPEI
jgi:hypothetical protein